MLTTSVDVMRICGPKHDTAAVLDRFHPTVTRDTQTIGWIRYQRQKPDTKRSTWSSYAVL